MKRPQVAEPSAKTEPLFTELFTESLFNGVKQNVQPNSLGTGRSRTT
jgi:hypothetical protein